MRKVFFILFLFSPLFVQLFIPLFPQTAFADFKSADKLKNSEEEVREYMLSISKQLGASCVSCHIQENFRDDRKVEFKVALEHIKLTQLLIDKGLDGKKMRKADCFMCHRGEIKPKF